MLLGGGKDLAAAASIQENRESKLKLEDMIKNETKQPQMMGGNSKMGGNAMPFEMMRNSPSKFCIIDLCVFGDFYKIGWFLVLQWVPHTVWAV